MSQTSIVTLTRPGDGISLVTLNAPPMNLVGRQMLAALAVAFDQLAAAAPRVVVVTGAGGRAFSAGADIKEFPEFAAAAATRGRVAALGQRTFDRLAAFPMPTIAAIEGLALGGGLELALACDLRIAAEGSRLGLPETGLGIFPCYGGTQRLPALIGMAATKELIYTGEPVDVPTALRLGLVNRLAAPGTALTMALELAATIAGRSGQAVRAAKQAIEASAIHSLAEGQALEADLADILFPGHDAREGVAAFIEKRPPQFDHRQ